MLAPARNFFTIERRPLAALDGIVEPWRDLSARAAEPNVFYEADFALAAAPVLGCNVEVILIWSADMPRRLVGLIPFEIAAHRYGVKLPVMIGWRHRFGPLGTPLVDRDACGQVVATLLDHVANDHGLPKLLLLPFLNESGPVAHAISSAIERIGGVRARFGCHRRALLKPGAERTGYLDRAIGNKRRKELRRQRHRLEDVGPVKFAVAATPADVAQALPDFLALEAGGWKGRAGTAIVQDPDIRRFVETAIGRLVARRQARVARLCCGSRPVAAALLLTSGDGAWGWKIAYDERFGGASPGVQIYLDVTEALLAESDVAFADSCAAPDHPMIDHIWRERLDISDWLLAPAPGVTFNVACALETVRRHAGDFARNLRNLFRRAD